MTNPTGQTKEMQDAEDALAIRLSNLASPVAKVRTGRNSRFWFTMDDVTTNQKRVKKKKAMIRPQLKPKSLDHIDSEVVDRLAVYRVDSPAVLSNHIKAVREFFLTEIAPRTLAASGGTTQATEIVGRLLETEVDSSTVARFNNMVNRATTLKMAEFVATYFGLPKESIPDLIGSPRPPMDQTTQVGQLTAMVGDLVRKSGSDTAKAVQRIERALTDKK